MYNLLVTAEEGAWDRLFYEYDRSRFLEYTNDKVAKAFKGLTEKRIATLKSFPCVFAYEGTGNNVRIGYLKSIKEQGRSILIEYKFHPEIPEIPFSSLKPIAPLLDIRDWEMNRTHWAVKDEDLFERLQTASLIKPDPNKPPKKQEDIDKLPEIETHSRRVQTVHAFITEVLSKRGEGDFEVFYRGHSNKRKYKLEPSLFRKDDDGNYLYLDNEHILYRELIVSNSSDFASDEYTLDRLVRMQHYSLPTRLLDITSNPLIALYFACKPGSGIPQGGKHVEEEEGEVIIFSLRREQVKYFDSDTASCIANLARLPKSEKDNIAFADADAFNNQLAIKRLTHFIREEKPFFEPRIVPEHLRTIVCVKGKKSNDRISFQSGAFLLFGLDAVLDEKGSPEIQVSRISVANKTSILRELDLLNINESTVFPYIENSARYVAQKYAFSKSIQPTVKSVTRSIS
jgi:hypothetical protein